MKIIFTRTFDKELSKIGSITSEDIIREVGKYARWLDNFIELYEYEDGKVLKGYFPSKKVRVCIWFREIHGQFVPFFIARKESREWYNIAKADKESHELILDRYIEDIERGEFITIEV
jgi:hypothetical protein